MTLSPVYFKFHSVFVSVIFKKPYFYCIFPFVCRESKTSKNILSKNWNAGYFVFCEIEDVNYSTALLYLQITIFKHWAKCCVS